VLPVTPNATQQTKNVLCYLYSEYKNHILTGQEEDSGGTAYDVEFNYINQTTGKYPVVRAFDVNNAGNDTRCLAQWNAGGLCMFGYHMGAPNEPDGYTGALSGTQPNTNWTQLINSAMTAGTSENTTLNSRLDNVVTQVKSVQSGGGVVILRLFHECTGNWFWWSMGGGTQFVSLWKYAYNYILSKGVTNVLWLLPMTGSPNAAFYPGPQWVDIGGADNYNVAYDYDPMNALYNSCVKIFGNTMPIALHECGPVPDTDQLQSTKTYWSFFSIWTSPFPENDSTTGELQKVYGSSYAITRDKMPNLK
jgi:beta-mannanase